MFEQITCKDCHNYRNSRCPRREYRDQKLNDIAVGPNDTPCDEIRSKIPGKTAFESYTMEHKRNKIYLFNEEGDIIFSQNYKSIDGPQCKKRIEELTESSKEEIDKILANFTYSSKNQESTSNEPKPSELTIEFDEDVKEKAHQLVHDSAFFYKLGKVFELGFIISKINKPRFIIGEERNKRLLPPLLIGASILKMTSIVKFLGPPGTAKDTQVRMTLDLLPIKYVERSYVTAASLRYSQTLKDAVLLYIPDSPELKGETGRTLRFMRSDDGGLISEYATKDNETGEMTTKICTVPVKGVVTTSNAITGDTALQSGMWTLQTNGTPELTSKVKREKLKLRAGNRELFPEDELEVWKCAFNILLTEEVPETRLVVPFAEDLFYLLESSRSESRRDPDKLCDLIILVAWMRRFQKCPDVRNVADFIDLYTALQIGLDAITETICELDQKETKIFGAVNEGDSKTIREVVDATKFPYKTCYSYLEKLIERGFLNKDKDKGKNYYSVLTENTPKTLLVSEGGNLEDAENQIEQVLGAITNFSLSRYPIEGSFIDPITGNKIDIIIHEGKPRVVVEKKASPYPYENVRILKQSTETSSESENKPKKLPLEQTRNETGSFPICFYCNKPILLKNLSHIDGKLVCKPCVEKYKSERRKGKVNQQ